MLVRSAIYNLALEFRPNRLSPPSSPLPTRAHSSINFEHSLEHSLPTDARIAQKARLKEMKEKGITPKKKKQIVEEGTDDCGADLSGLGPNIILYGCDWTTGKKHTK